MRFLAVLLLASVAGCAGALESVSSSERVRFVQCAREPQGALGCDRPGCAARRAEEFAAVEGAERRTQWLRARGCPAAVAGEAAADPPWPTSYTGRNIGIGVGAAGYVLSILGGLFAPSAAWSLFLPVVGQPLLPVACGTNCTSVPASILGSSGFALQVAGLSVAAAMHEGTPVRPAP